MASRDVVLSDDASLVPNIEIGTILRRYREIASQVVADQGGRGELSEIRRQLIRRFSACAVLAEREETALVNGKKFDVGRFVLLCSLLAKLAGQLGIDPRPRTIMPPNLSDYLELTKNIGGSNGKHTGAVE
jgi:hypothetical protein